MSACLSVVLRGCLYYGVQQKPMILAVFLVDVEFSRFRTFANEFPLSVHFGSKFTHINEDPKSWEG